MCWVLTSVLIVQTVTKRSPLRTKSLLFQHIFDAIFDEIAQSRHFNEMLENSCMSKWSPIEFYCNETTDKAALVDVFQHH